ncbi:mRNA interferase MazF [Aquiflexum balticum DSM 16537]|uniref:mRNA interferase MazF n=1 Tax=Aquiflexum balticum DSM 16537 TaxID=758820 RepID=A0A1W2HBG9_9BACT|nr:type II toxin-antitoxin system PemK/MazF family toxin [Aquiflexum balticum]SMD46230.1 mRNA interferase MazF [Aquiflexum balticum DSM 16537]
MEQLNFGDIVLLKFPFTDTKGAKKRPALVIKDFEDGDIIVCRITSQLYETQFDFLLKNWKECGLILPSVIRVHKIATLEKNIVEMKMGEINSKSKKAISKIIKKLMV